MNAKLSSRYPILRVAFLAAILFAMVLVAAEGASRSGRMNLSAVAALEPASPATAGPLVWVRQDAPVINVNNDPTFYEAPEGDRFEGSYWEYIVDETAITYEQRYVDHDYEWYHITLSSEFDRPPLVINSSLRYKLTAQASRSATTTEGADGVGFQMWYNSDYATVDPHEVLAYYPWSPYFTGQDTKTWMVSAPEPLQAGDTFELYTSWWNCPPCNITWTYKAEPAYEVEQLGVQVVAPVVTYQGEEVAPGETFFPGTCALPDGRASILCSYTTEISRRGWVDMMCAAAQQEKLLSILEFIDLSAQEENNAKMKELVAWIVAVEIADNCAYNRSEVNAYQLELGMEQGGMVLSNAVTGQSLVVHTPLGKATAAKPGTLLAGYNPNAKVATFRSYSVPIVIQSKAGPSLSLPPGRQVRLTSTGFGPVTPLRQVFLPATIR